MSLCFIIIHFLLLLYVYKNISDILSLPAGTFFYNNFQRNKRHKAGKISNFPKAFLKVCLVCSLNIKLSFSLFQNFIKSFVAINKIQICGRMVINAHIRKAYQHKIIETLEKNKFNPQFPAYDLG